MGEDGVDQCEVLGKPKDREGTVINYGVISSDTSQSNMH